jgi:hypothetical protein
MTYGGDIRPEGLLAEPSTGACIMQHGVGRIDAVLDRVMDELGNPGARAEVAESIERSFEIFHLYDELSGRVGRQNLITSARQIAAAITTLEHQLHAVIAALNTLENQLRTAQPSLVSYGFRRGSTVPPGELDALLDATYLPLEPWRVARLRYEKFLADAAVERLPPGPEFDRAQRHCALLAYLLMRRLSARPITRSVTGPFYNTASLLYEALVGRLDVDLHRHCNWVLDHPPGHIDFDERQVGPTSA